jgi:hypothetical protein
MADDRSSRPPLAEPAPPASPTAWQPFTPRGVASFASAAFGRLLLIEFIIASLTAGAFVWFLAENWFPAVRHAIHQLPEQGTIRNQELQSPLTFAETLSENRPFLMVVLDLEKQRNASQTSDVLLEFHRNNFQVCSLFGCIPFRYPKKWVIEFNRPNLAPRWEAWESLLLSLTALFIIFALLLAWAFLATAYCGLVRLLGFFKDRDLNWARSWRLSSAALMPGALLLTAGIFFYGLGVVDLIRLLVLFILHLVLGWIYLAISPGFVPRLPAVRPPRVNPFVASSPAPPSDLEAGP